MSQSPILILQMQRMGDLVLTFPLVLWLSRLHPNRPIWVVAEKDFYEGLMPISPQVTYFPWDGLEILRKEQYRLVINLSHRPEAAWLAGELRAEEKIGPVREGENTYIRGDWQLYRASLVHNNRHNRFHWAELNALDVVPLAKIAATGWPEPRPAPVQSTSNGNRRRIGLFLGASEEIKRPPATFLAELVRELVHRGLRPALLGGPAEEALGREVASLSKERVPNLCGKFKLKEFVQAGWTLSLLITPDTGPMHVAAWSGLRTLNLSIGPVNPWETGPYPPGHQVLQARMSCRGCWRCHRAKPFCRENFQPGRIAFLAKRMVDGRMSDGRSNELHKLAMPGLSLFSTAQGKDGLFALKQGDALPAPTARQAVEEFWKAFYGARFGLWGMERAATALADMAENHPRLRRPFSSGIADIGRRLAKSLKKEQYLALEEDFWSKRPPLIRPLSGYLHLFLQNTDYSPQGFRQALALLDDLITLMD